MQSNCSSGWPLQSTVRPASECVLPLSEQALPDGMHQGTRHRAALGISEKSNSMVIVISEETGAISVAENGLLHRDLDSTVLREYLYRFYDPLHTSSSGVKGLIAIRRGNRQPVRTPRSPRALMIDSFWLFATFLTAMLLAVATWLIVANQVNPPKTATIDAIQLRPINRSEDLMVVSDIPKTVTAMVQAPADVIEALTPQLTILPLQLFSYYVADLRGTDVDQPRNLAKSVVVE